MLGLCDQVIWCLRSHSFYISFLDTQYQKNHSACLSPPYTDNHTCTCTWGAEEEGGNGDRQLVIQGPDKYVGPGREVGRKKTSSNVENFSQTWNNMVGTTSLGTVIKTVTNAVHREAKRHVEDIM